MMAVKSGPMQPFLHMVRHLRPSGAMWCLFTLLIETGGKIKSAIKLRTSGGRAPKKQNPANKHWRSDRCYSRLRAPVFIKPVEHE